MGGNIKKDIYKRLNNADKGIVILSVSMKKDMHYTKEEICAVQSMRDKKDNLDTSKIPDGILGAAVNKIYKLRDKNKLEADFDMYEIIVDLIEKKKIQKEPIDRYANNFSLLKEAKSEKTAAKKFGAEQVGNGLISEEDLKNIEIIADMMKKQMQKEESNKLNKELGKEIKDNDMSEKDGVDVDKLNELIEELGLDGRLKIR